MYVCIAGDIVEMNQDIKTHAGNHAYVNEGSG